MTIITISRQFGSGGDEIANRLSALLNYPCFDKSMVAKAAQEAGLSEQEIIDYSEDSHKVRTFFDRLFNRPLPVASVRVWRESLDGVRTNEEYELSENSAVALMQKAIQMAYQEGNMIIVGRGGQALLKGRPDVLHLRIIAPLEDRIQHLKEQLKESRQIYQADLELRRLAQDQIIERDNISADYLKRFYHIDWDDPSYYHLIINTGMLSIEQAAEMIAALVRQFHPQTETNNELLVNT
ncbi:MAG TPA: cytidylate kinase-like family protein [Anaerolineaceae bacterium]